MSRKSKRRKRERKKLKHEQQKQLALAQLAQHQPPARPSTAKLFEILESLSHITGDVIAESEQQ